MHCYFVVFFFKQKTAYEMRISDWSSDVCSSDLQTVHLMCDLAILVETCREAHWIGKAQTRDCACKCRVLSIRFPGRQQRHRLDRQTMSGFAIQAEKQRA